MCTYKALLAAALYAVTVALWRFNRSRKMFCFEIQFCCRGDYQVCTHCTCCHGDGLGAPMNPEMSNQIFVQSSSAEKAIKKDPCCRLCLVSSEVSHCFRNDFVCWALEENVGASGQMICGPSGLDFLSRGFFFKNKYIYIFLYSHELDTTCLLSGQGFEI